MLNEITAIPPNKNNEILKSLNLDKIYGNPNWDDNAFIESYFELKKELEHSSNKTITLSKFYEDAIFAKKTQDYSDYEDKFSLPPLEIHLPLSDETTDWENSKKIIATNVSSLNQKNNYTLLVPNPLKLIQYGPSRLYNLASSAFTFIPYEHFSADDLLGSDAFTACSAIVIKTKNGIFFAHITTGHLGVRGILEYLEKNYKGQEKINLIRPQWSKNGQLVEEYEKWWEKLATDFPDIIINKYAYIAADSDRPNKISDSSILVSQDQISIIGRNRYSEKKAAFDYDSYQAINF